MKEHQAVLGKLRDCSFSLFVSRCDIVHTVFAKNDGEPELTPGSPSQWIVMKSLSRAARAPRRSLSRTFIVAVSLATISACTEVTKIAAPTPISPSTPRNLLVSGPPKHVREEERTMAELAKLAPSVGGIYVAPDGGIHVLVVKPTDDAPARAAVASLMSKRQDKSDSLYKRPVTVERAQFSFAELSDWRDLESDSVLTDLPGLVMLDLDERRNRVVIGIALDAPSSTRAAIQARSARLGIDSAALIIENRQTIKLTSALSTSAALSRSPGYDLQQYFDSLVGGVRIVTAMGTCSSGLVVEHNGVAKAVVASHCTTTWAGLDNTTVTQGGILRGAEKR